MKYLLNNNYQNGLKKCLFEIKHQFNNSTTTIHKARNELKIINCSGIDIVVKSFKIPNIFKRFLYTFINKSKAQKSYEYSLIIEEFTPEAIGYIEFYKNKMLYDSYFLSRNFTYDFTIRDALLDDNFNDKEGVFHSFAEFTHSLHQKNIYHQDYSPGNILIKKENNIYTYKIVDINRMKFKKLTAKDKLKNFSKLWAKDNDLKIMISHYAKISNIEIEESIKIALKYSKRHKNMKNMKKRFKGEKVVD
jgi:serine/threonine protein kinase